MNQADNRKHENPYFPFELESGKWFYHEDVIEQINHNFSENPDNPIIIVGDAGNGKTSTLKRIAVDQQKLEAGMHAIYIDSRTYPTSNLYELVPKFFSDIHEQIKKKGLPVKPGILPTISKPTPKNITNLLETLKPLLPAGESVIIIMDEFENIMENSDEDTKKFFLDCFVEIAKKPATLKLILAVERERERKNPEKKLLRFLKRCVRIKVEDFMKDEAITKLIMEPKGRESIIKFTDGALSQIKSLCGNNLYLQQLICYYIFEYLNQNKRTSCDVSDVDDAVKILIDDPRPDFRFAWKYKLSLPEKLIISALADSEYTRQERGYYYLVENTLVDDILGIELYHYALKLYYENKLSLMERRQFKANPFRLPLFGKWIKKMYPFLRTVELYLKDIASLSISTVGKILNSYPQISINEETSQSNILQFSSQWYLLKTKVEEDKATEEDFLEFAKLFCKISFGIDVTIRNLERGYFSFPIHEQKIGHFKKAVIFIQEKPYLNSDDCRDIQNKILSYGNQEFETIFFLIVFEKTPHIEALLQKDFLRIIYLDEANLKGIITNERPFDSLRKEIINQSSPYFLSPYQPEGAAITTFFGRIKVQRRILANSNQNCVIVGTRRIGKSSLLHNIIRNLPPNTISIDLDLSQCKNFETFFQRISQWLRENLKNIEPANCSTPQQFHSMIQNLAKQFKEEKRQLLFIFDEIDSVIKFDRENKYSLLESFRVLANEGYARFIIAGFAELFRAKRELNSPLYNFGDVIQLGPLNEDAAIALVTEPMKSIGLVYQNPQDARRILKYTSCHPSLTQYFCQRLIKTVERKQNKKYRRTITKRDIEKVFDDEYKKHIINDIYMLRIGEIPPIQELIIVLLAEKFHEVKKFNFEKIQYYLRAIQIDIDDNVLTENLQELEIRFILRDEENGFYAFPLEVFPEILRDRYILEDYKKSLLKKLSEVNQ